MIRPFNHYVHRMMLARMLFDIALMFAAIVGGVLLYAESLQRVVPLAGTHAVSMAAGLFVINAASGFY
jgi:hypothetical protein